MYTESQVMEGILLYIKNEVIPVLPTSARLMVGAAVLHNSGRVADMLKSNKAEELMKTIDLVSSDGMVDVDIWSQELKHSMEEFCCGKVEVQIPFLSPVIFSSSDVDTLKRYIKGELR